MIQQNHPNIMPADPISQIIYRIKFERMRPASQNHSEITPTLAEKVTHATIHTLVDAAPRWEILCYSVRLFPLDCI